MNQILAFGLGHEWLELGCGEGVHQASLGDDEKEDLCASKD